MSSILKIKDSVGTTTFVQNPNKQADEQPTSDQHIAKAGNFYPVNNVDRGSSDSYNGHWKVEFTSPLRTEDGTTTIENWYVFRDDVEEYRLVP
jgi:hypothetical protein